MMDVVSGVSTGSSHLRETKFHLTNETFCVCGDAWLCRGFALASLVVAKKHQSEFGGNASRSRTGPVD
jgi:hypothetical protein